MVFQSKKYDTLLHVSGEDMAGLDQLEYGEGEVMKEVNASADRHPWQIIVYTPVSVLLKPEQVHGGSFVYIMNAECEGYLCYAVGKDDDKSAATTVSNTQRKLYLQDGWYGLGANAKSNGLWIVEDADAVDSGKAVLWKGRYRLRHCSTGQWLAVDFKSRTEQQTEKSVSRDALKCVNCKRVFDQLKVYCDTCCIPLVVNELAQKKDMLNAAEEEKIYYCMEMKVRR